MTTASDPESSPTTPDFASARHYLRAALVALSTDPDEYDNAAVNLIWEDVHEATLRLETMLGIDGTP
jgi:hypothetical protein